MRPPSWAGPFVAALLIAVAVACERADHPRLPEARDPSAHDRAGAAGPHGRASGRRRSGSRRPADCGPGAAQRAGARVHDRRPAYGDPGQERLGLPRHAAADRLLRRAQPTTQHRRGRADANGTRKPRAGRSTSRRPSRQAAGVRGASSRGRPRPKPIPAAAPAASTATRRRPLRRRRSPAMIPRPAINRASRRRARPASAALRRRRQAPPQPPSTSRPAVQARRRSTSDARGAAAAVHQPCRPCSSRRRRRQPRCRASCRRCQICPCGSREAVLEERGPAPRPRRPRNPASPSAAGPTRVAAAEHDAARGLGRQAHARVEPARLRARGPVDVDWAKKQLQWWFRGLTTAPTAAAGQWRWEMSRAPFADFARVEATAGPRLHGLGQRRAVLDQSQPLRAAAAGLASVGIGVGVHATRADGRHAGGANNAAQRLGAQPTFSQRPGRSRRPARRRPARSAGAVHAGFRTLPPLPGVAVALRPRGRAGHGRQRRRPAEQLRRAAVRSGREGAAVRSRRPSTGRSSTFVSLPPGAGLHVRLAVLGRSVEGHHGAGLLGRRRRPWHQGRQDRTLQEGHHAQCLRSRMTATSSTTSSTRWAGSSR